MSQTILEVRDLVTRFTTQDGDVQAVNSISFSVNAGERVGIVGESGSGKSQTFMSIMGLLATNGHISGSIKLNGRELVGLTRDELNDIRGREMAMIFQDPMTCLNPYLRISKQLTEVLVKHKGLSELKARELAMKMLDRVGIADVERRFDMYPHEFSGGMRQRVMIAMALLCAPDLLIADEPTTALDVTVQAQILDLFRDLKADNDKTALAIITHDLGVIAGLCDRVIVLYGGRIVEQGTVKEIFYSPRHPYTKGLLSALPRFDMPARGLLPTIPGQPPNLQRLPAGCAFSPRCPSAFDRCRAERPPYKELAPGRGSTCFLEEV
jgi:oligopeptide transport system ATP-binding protein